MKKILVFSFLLVLTQFVFAQREICGTVLEDSSGEALIGVAVILKGTTTGTITDIDGKYCLEVPLNAKNIEFTFSFVGFEYQTIKVLDANVLDAKLKEDKISLDEVIVEYHFEKHAKMSNKGTKIISSRKRRPLKEVLMSSESSPKKSAFIPPPPPPSHKSVKKLAPNASMRVKDVSGFRESPTAKPKPKAFTKEDFGDFGESDLEENFMTITFDGDEVDSNPYKPNLRAGLLTAGEINDFSKWEMWQDIAAYELKEYQTRWGFFTKNRYTVQVSTERGKPIVDANVRLFSSKNRIHWQAKTDNTGKAELWLNMFDAVELGAENLKIEVAFGREKEILKAPKDFKKGINFVSLQTSCNLPKNADVLFVVDATSSMSDEIKYLKAELKDVMGRVKEQRTDLNLRLGSVFYRDHNDEYLTVKSDFSSEIDQTVEFIQNNHAKGGGDYEEAVEDALEVGINEMEWSENAVTRLLFLVLDAPPHQTPEVNEKLKILSQKAAEKGIRIIPIGASGINKSAEFLMRSLALASNGTYTFLTDHSGIGSGHIAPSTDDYDMEFLNDLLVRLIDQLTQMTDCEEDTHLVEAAKAEIISEEILKIFNFHPNPVANELTIDLKSSIEALFITDLSGKILQRLDSLQKGKNLLDMSPYPSGIYFLRYTTIEGKEGSAKLIVVH
ncbi:MAG: carboxypeptidase-like regulatory domain-containing protein [Chitinophagales bacterium]